MLCTRCSQIEVEGSAPHADLCAWCATIAQVTEESDREEQAKWARELADLRAGLAEVECTEDEATLRAAAWNVDELLVRDGHQLKADLRAVLEDFAAKHR